MFFLKRPYFSVFLLLILLVVIINVDWNRKSNFKYEDITPIFLINNFSTDSLRTGDIVLRSGTGIYSWLNRTVFSKSKKYSHCGVISIEGDTVFVYHALGGRESVTNQLRKTGLFHYANKKATSSLAFYRFPLSEKQRQKMALLIHSVYNNRVEFDSAFDLESDETLYHTEFVYHIITSALDDDSLIKTSSFFGKEYINIDNIYNNEQAELIAAFEHE